jgi:hypothetical protein
MKNNKKTILKRLGALLLAAVFVFSLVASSVMISRAVAPVITPIMIKVVWANVLTGMTTTASVMCAVTAVALSYLSESLLAVVGAEEIIYKSAYVGWRPVAGFQGCCDTIGHVSWDGSQKCPTVALAWAMSEVFQTIETFNTPFFTMYTFEEDGDDVVMCQNTHDLMHRIGQKWGVALVEGVGTNTIIGNGTGTDVPGLTETAEGWSFKTNRGSISIDGHVYETLSTLRMSDLMEITYREWVTENHDTVIDGRTVNFRGRVNIIPYFLHNNDVYISSSMTIAQLGAPYTVSNGFTGRTGVVATFQGSNNIMRFQASSNTARDLTTQNRGSSGSHIGIIRHYTFGDTLDVSRENWTSGGFSGSFVLSGDISFYSRHPGTGVIGEHSRIREIYGITDSFLNLSNGELINLNNETHISKQEKEKLELKFIVANHNPAVGYFEHLMRVMTPDSVVTVPPPLTINIPKTEEQKAIEEGRRREYFPPDAHIRINPDGTINAVGDVPWNELLDRLNMPQQPPMNLPDPTIIPGDGTPFILDRFPFTLPWDLWDLFSLLIVDLDEDYLPIFEYDFIVKNETLGVDINRKIVVDPTRFRVGDVDVVRTFIRWVSSILYVFLLVKLSVKFTLPK